MNINLNNRPILRNLGDGLILCRSMAIDADALGEFNSRIHSDDGFDKPDLRVGAWTRDLVARPHPTFHEDNCTLVVEAGTGKIISSMNLIPQTWAYEGIPFGAGRPELVGTLAEFRNRGLVRAQFEEVHKWSAENGHLLQGITGIPFYYRLFGYEMALELGGGRTGFEPQLPALKEGESEPFTIRAANDADIPFIMEAYAHGGLRRLITCVRDENNWRYELSGMHEQNVERLEFRILENPGTHEPVGYFTHPWYDWDTGLAAFHYELKPGVSWLETTPTVARYLWKTGETYSKRDSKPAIRTTYSFWFGSEHPAYEVFRERLPRLRDPYAWYIRVPDLPAFLCQIAPALERHIAESAIVGYSGEARISFYHSGVRLVLDKGRLVTIESWKPCHEDQGNAAFPNVSFLQLVFGYRSFEELEQSYADCTYKDDERRILLSTLFPKKASSV
ncbi:MAG: GNAT family N-acetyltransferase, partial [Anaerolineales bacterium]